MYMYHILGMLFARKSLPCLGIQKAMLLGIAMLDVLSAASERCEVLQYSTSLIPLPATGYEGKREGQRCLACIDSN